MARRFIYQAVLRDMLHLLAVVRKVSPSTKLSMNISHASSGAFDERRMLDEAIVKDFAHSLHLKRCRFRWSFPRLTALVALQ